MKRRSLLASALGTPALLTATPKRGLGVTISSYGIRWRRRGSSGETWRDAIDVLEHCGDLGAGCLQIGVRGWTRDFAGKVRERRETLGIALEGQIGLPKTDADLPRFETELVAAKEAGAEVLRTVCLGGRRYETFEDLGSWQEFSRRSRAALQRAEPVLAKHRVNLGVENHKDWRIGEQLALLREIDSEWVGVTLDFGNNFALLEHPHAVAAALAPFVMTTHLKDMALAKYEDGFLLSEVPLGQGVLDLNRMMDICAAANPRVFFNLEMITRNPLRIPVFEDSYWATLGKVPATDLVATLRVAERGRADSLPTVEGRTDRGKVAFEEENVRQSLAFARERLGCA